MAAFTISDNVSCAGNTVSFTDQSANNPTAWSWTFSGGTPATSNSQNPSVVYDTPGTYDVSLTVTNPYGSDDLTETGMITVGAEANTNTLDWEWASHILDATPSGGTVADVGVDAFGNTFIAGTFKDSVVFGNFSVVDPNAPSNFSCGYLAKFDSNGACLWAVGAGLNQSTVVDFRAFDVDSEGNCYVAGGFRASNAQVDFGSLSAYGYAGNNSQMVLVKYDANGTANWIKTGTGPEQRLDNGLGVAVDGLGNVFVTGSYNGTSVNGGGTPYYIGGMNISPFNDDLGNVFLAKFTTSGTPLWAENIGSLGLSGYVAARDICTDPAGNVYLTGHFDGSIDFDPNSGTITNSNGSSDIFIARYSVDGYLDFIKQYGSTTSPVFGCQEERGNSISIGSDNSIYCTGNFFGTASFGPYSVTANGNCDDVFLLRANLSSGNPNWVRSLGSTIDDFAEDLVLDDYNNVYFTTATSNLSIDQQNFLGFNIIMTKYDNNGTLIWAEPMPGRGSWGGSGGLASNGDFMFYGSSLYGSTQLGDYNLAADEIGSSDMYVTKFGEYECPNLLPEITTSQTGSVCSNLENVLTAPIGFANYTWSNGETTPSITVTEEGDYSVEVIMCNGCAGQSADVTVSFLPPPTATVTAAGATTFCAGASVTLNANIGPNLDYQWLKDGTEINGSTNSSLTATEIGNYTVEVTDANGCISESNAIMATVLPLPSIAVSPIDAVSMCQGDSVMLYGSVNANYSYQWFDGNGQLSGETASSYKVFPAGEYYVEITDQN
ncbi:MAG: PKD domain-containing protein, partial [Flavobacteriales bacterium]|nr:PKD domain-containing protein [Flavobacteriales bacterium]